MISDFFFKKLGKMIGDEYYDLNERFAPRLLDAGFITLERESGYSGAYHISSSFYVVTEKGKEAYNEWKASNTSNNFKL